MEDLLPRRTQSQERGASGAIGPSLNTEACKLTLLGTLTVPNGWPAQAACYDTSYA